jgi:hypothetical protein
VIRINGSKEEGLFVLASDEEGEKKEEGRLAF